MFGLAQYSANFLFYGGYRGVSFREFFFWSNIGDDAGNVLTPFADRHLRTKRFGAAEGKVNVKFFMEYY
jgi:hypothetical protein